MEPQQADREQGQGRLEDHGRLLARYQDAPSLYDPHQPTDHGRQPAYADKGRRRHIAPFLRFPYKHMM
jgi:hypothetical protein